MRFILAALLSTTFAALGACTPPAMNVTTPERCEPSVNDDLARLIGEQHAGAVDNVMVCGTTIGPSRALRGGGRRPGHHLLPVRVRFSGGRGTALVEVVTNDDLDGPVTASSDTAVIAYGQYFRTGERQRPFVAGVHEVHCSTHHGANNGWVVVDGTKYPQQGC